MTARSLAYGAWPRPYPDGSWPKIHGFIITTRYKPAETVQFMKEEVARYPELEVFKNYAAQPDELYKTNPDQCCQNLKVEPSRWAGGTLDPEDLGHGLGRQTLG